jgi:pentatricopeptide repeat protein
MFEKIRDRSVLTWTAIVSACERHGLGTEARRHFSQMLREGFMPNEHTLTSAVAVCGSTVALEEGRLIHTLASESGFDADDIFMNALVSMYGRCGTADDASTMFERMRGSRTVVTWTALLASYAQHGDGCGAIQRFHRMHGEGFEANEISFVSVISACSHAGLVLEGCYCLSSMLPEFGIVPIAMHYSCLMDLFGRAGDLDIAAYIIDQMPFQPDSDEWYTLLCSCKSQGDVERGKCAAEHALELYPTHSAAYVSLSNIYASAGTGESCAKSECHQTVCVLESGFGGFCQTSNECNP